MQQALTAEQTRGLEVAAAEALGVSVAGLMSAVGAAVAEHAITLAPEGRIVVLAGPGNNAGDGWVAARLLRDAGRDVRVLAASEPAGLPDPAADAARRAIEEGVQWISAGPEEVVAGLDDAALAVDALFGLGVRGPLREPFASIVLALNDADLPVLSIDLPSGVESDTGRASGAAVDADHTLAILTRKVGHVQEPGRTLAGRMEVTTVGLEPASTFVPGALEVWEARDVAATIPRPGPLDHKGSRGRLAIVGGSRGMTGAVVLAAWGALRSGAGYVTCGVPLSLVDVVDAGVVPAVVRGLPETPERSLEDSGAEVVIEALGRADALVLGPGLGSGATASALARELVATCRMPLVVDADALSAFASGAGDLAGAPAARVLTPHPGEAGRLLGVDARVVQEDRLRAARELASLADVCVLKGACTVVASRERAAVVTAGSAALATMGTGDVLAGVIGTLLAQGLDPFDAACAGAYLHGLAGEVAGNRLTDAGTTALDVAEALAEALSRVSAAER